MSAEQEKKIFDALTAPNTVLQPGERSLTQIAELMNQVVPTWIDLMALRDTTYTVDEVFTITAEDAGTSLASTLVRMFHDRDLTLNVRNSLVEITSTDIGPSGLLGRYRRRTVYDRTVSKGRPIPVGDFCPDLSSIIDTVAARYAQSRHPSRRTGHHWRCLPSGSAGARKAVAGRLAKLSQGAV